eukprot:3473775-Prorocentrum_lima.AAC.1
MGLRVGTSLGTNGLAPGEPLSEESGPRKGRHSMALDAGLLASFAARRGPWHTVGLIAPPCGV